MMPNTADIAAQAGVRAILEDWARRIDDDGTPSQIISAEEIRAALAAIEPQAVAETLHGPFGWLNGRRELSEEHWTLERDPLENSDEHFAIPLFAKVDPFQEAKPDALDHLLNFIVSDDTPVRPEDEADLRLFNEATMEGIAKFALRAAAASPVTASDEIAVEAALREAIDVLDGLNDDEINLELMPRLRAALAAAPKAQPVQGLVSHKTALGDTQPDLPIADDRQAHPVQGWRDGTPTHRHVKRGSEYVLLGIGKMQSEDWYAFGTPVDRVDMREVAIYRSVDDGSLWARPREEFEDGRFEPLPAGPSSKETANG